MLVVSEDSDQLETLCRGLRVLGMSSLPARTAAEAFALLDAGHVELLLADVTFPGALGARVVERAARLGLPVLLLTGLVLTDEVRALRAGGLTILRKPFGPEELSRAIGAALAKWRD